MVRVVVFMPHERVLVARVVDARAVARVGKTIPNQAQRVGDFDAAFTGDARHGEPQFQLGLC